MAKKVRTCCITSKDVNANVATTSVPDYRLAINLSNYTACHVPSVAQALDAGSALGVPFVF